MKKTKSQNFSKKIFKTEHTSFRINPDLHEIVSKCATEENISFSNYITNAIIEKVSKHNLNEIDNTIIRNIIEMRDLFKRNWERKKIRIKRSEYISKLTMLRRLQIDYMKIITIKNNKKEKENIIKNLINSYLEEANNYKNNFDIISQLEELLNDSSQLIETTNQILNNINNEVDKLDYRQSENTKGLL